MANLHFQLSWYNQIILYKVFLYSSLLTAHHWLNEDSRSELWSVKSKVIESTRRSPKAHEGRREHTIATELPRVEGWWVAGGLVGGMMVVVTSTVRQRKRKWGCLIHRQPKLLLWGIGYLFSLDVIKYQKGKMLIAYKTSKIYFSYKLSARWYPLVLNLKMFKIFPFNTTSATRKWMLKRTTHPVIFFSLKHFTLDKLLMRMFTT